MFARPEAQSFTKFLVSTGVFLCIVAFVAPALVLRETDVLRVTTDELARLTDLGGEELRRRQAVARDVAKAAPFAGAVLFLAGVALIAYAMPRMHRQEQAEDARSEAELHKLRAEVSPQTEDEQLQKLRAEVSVEVDEAAADDPRGDERTSGPRATGDAANLPEARDAVPDILQHRAGRMVERAQGIERRVLRRIDHIASPAYVLRPHVRTGGRTRLLLDGVLTSEVDQLPDIVVEIKHTSYLRKMGSMRVREAIATFAIYRMLVDPSAMGWLIIVPAEPVDDAERRRLLSRYEELRDLVTVTILEETEIEGLQLPFHQPARRAA